MKTVTITVARDKAARAEKDVESFELNVPETFFEAENMYTPTTAWNVFYRELITAAQQMTRPLIVKGKTHAEIQTVLYSWKPATRVITGVSSETRKLGNVYAELKRKAEANTLTPKELEQWNLLVSMLG